MPVKLFALSQQIKSKAYKGRGKPHRCIFFAKAYEMHIPLIIGKDKRKKNVVFVREKK